MKFDLYQAMVTLKTDWQTLHDVDKADRIAQILAAGMSDRTLGKSVGHSEGLIRYLKPLHDATPEEKELARNGKLSTAELLRNLKTRREAAEQKQEQDHAAQQSDLARQAHHKVVNWLSPRFAPAYLEQIIDEARALLAGWEIAGKLPKGKAPAGMSFEEIMSRCEPAPLKSDDVHWLAREAFWLACGCYYAFPDSNVRDRALNLAWSTFVALGVPKKSPAPNSSPADASPVDDVPAAG